MVEDKYFRGATELEEIFLTKNQILEISCKSFADQGKLKILVLRHNKLENLQPGIFDSLVALEYMDLCGNQLVSLENDLFKRNSKMKIIKLNANQIMAIDSHIFDSLERIEDLDFGENFCAKVEILRSKEDVLAKLNQCFKNSEKLYSNFKDSSSNHCDYKSQNVTCFWTVIFLNALLTVSFIASLVYITFLRRRIPDNLSIHSNKIVFDDPHEYDEIYVHNDSPITCYDAPGNTNNVRRHSYVPMDGIGTLTTNETNQPSNCVLKRNESSFYENLIKSLTIKNKK